jgi:septum formation protein
VNLILASASQARAKILQGAAVPFTALPAAIDEEALKVTLLADGAPAEEIAAALAAAKASHVSTARPDSLVLGADQTLVFAGKLVNKSVALAQARTLLLQLRGKAHQLISALALAQGGKLVWTHSDTSTLQVRHFSEGFLDDYLAREGGALLGGVGCYRLEGMGMQLFESIEGDYFSILGLPLLPLLVELRKKGVIER